MTPATITLAALCAVLAMVVAWQRSMIVAGLELRQNIIENDADRHCVAMTEIHEQKVRISADSALIAEAHALLHDERHKGKVDNQKQWQAARAEWAGKVSAR